MKRMKTSVAAVAVALLLPLLGVASPVNVNTADAATISAELQGVGMSKAEAIVTYRKENGPFKTPADLMLVKGIGARTVEINKDDILVKPPKK